MPQQHRSRSRKQDCDIFEKQKASVHKTKGSTLVLRSASGAFLGILFDASDAVEAHISIRQQEMRYPIDSTERHFANFTAGVRRGDH